MEANFSSAFKGPAYEFDYIFDWTILEYQQTLAKKQPQSSPVSGVTSSGAVAVDLEKHIAKLQDCHYCVNCKSCSAEVTEHEGSNNLVLPGVHTQLRSPQNLGTDSPNDKHALWRDVCIFLDNMKAPVEV
ncbi:hypothetical protein GH714_036484 [Hevea brasiliensis]|uniref:Uncharacterized protein n=1 Tax=Hevea brasiliensis TaxID=3981 RepID=A0A6A6KDN4_HEVBR|nr:hypothetical protein GH714_036484 [Hevea brasiliensis]